MYIHLVRFLKIAFFYHYGFQKDFQKSNSKLSYANPFSFSYRNRLEYLYMDLTPTYWGNGVVGLF